MNGQVLAHTRPLYLWVVSLGGTMMHLTLSVLTVVVSVGSLVVQRDAIKVSTMCTKHLIVVRRSRGDMGLCRGRVDGHGIVSSHRAVMGLRCGEVMVSIVSGSEGMIKMRTWELLAGDLGVVVGVMWPLAIVVSLSLVMQRSFTIAGVVGVALTIVGHAMRTYITIVLMWVDFMLDVAPVLLLKYVVVGVGLLGLLTLGGCVLIRGLSLDRHY